MQLPAFRKTAAIAGIVFAVFLVVSIVLVIPATALKLRG